MTHRAVKTKARLGELAAPLDERGGSSFSPRADGAQAPGTARDEGQSAQVDRQTNENDELGRVCRLRLVLRPPRIYRDTATTRNAAQ